MKIETKMIEKMRRFDVFESDDERKEYGKMSTV